MEKSMNEIAQNELNELLPARSRWGTAAVAVICILALVAAWFVPPWLNPRLGPSQSGALYFMVDAPFALAESEISSDQRPATVLGADDLDDARVVGVWVTHNDQDAAGIQRAWETVDGSVCNDTGCTVSPNMWRPSDGPSLIDALTRNGAPLSSTEVPQKIGPGDQLWVLWQITDCTSMNTSGDLSSTTVRLRGLFGLPVHRAGLHFINPDNIGAESILESGSCPS